MLAASELPVASRALAATFIGHVDAARGVSTGSAVSFMPSRYWRLGVARRCTLLLLQKRIAASIFDTNNKVVYDDQNKCRLRDCE